MSHQEQTIERNKPSQSEVWKGDGNRRLAKSLITLIDQVDARWPTRDRSSDGSIGDAAHAARASDHNPNAAGVVTALDLDRDIASGFNARNLAESLVASRDRRIKYIISDGQIISSKVSPWEWRPYTGENAHRQHIHVSVDADPALYDDPRPWAIAALPPAPQLSMPGNFERVHPLIAKWEGGYSNDPDDAGGPTNFGITQARLAESRGRAVSAADVQALSYAEAVEIFKRYYWTPLRCDDLPLALATMTYNAGVNSGPARGARFLQQVLNRQGAGLEEDGIVGDETVKAARACPNVVQAVKDYATTYASYYQSLGNYPKFGRGWINRLNDITPQALAWASEQQQLPPPQPTGPTPMPPPNTATPYNANLEDCLIELAKAQRPILDRYLKAGTPVTDEEMRRLVIIQLGGTPPPSSQVVLPPPGQTQPTGTTATPAPAEPAPAASPTTVNISAALAGVLASLGLSATGVIGPPVGPDATTTGMLLPLLSMGAGALGIPAPIVNIIGTLFGRLFTPTPKA